jgi:hypothetical protein
MTTPVFVTLSAGSDALPSPAATPAIGRGAALARARSAASAALSPPSAWSCSHSSQPVARASVRSRSRACLVAARTLFTAARWVAACTARKAARGPPGGASRIILR